MPIPRCARPVLIVYFQFFAHTVVDPVFSARRAISSCVPRGGLKGRCGARRGGNTAEERQGRIPHHSGRLSFFRFGFLGKAQAVLAGLLEEAAPLAREGVGRVTHLASREDGGILPFVDVLAPPLDKVGGKLCAEGARGIGEGARELGELRFEKGEEIAEGRVVARVRGGGEHDEVAIALLREALEEGKAELAAAASHGAGVRLVHHDALGRARDKVVAVAFALDVVEAYNHGGKVIEDGSRPAGLHARGARRLRQGAAARMWKRSKSSPCHCSTRWGGQRTAKRRISPRSAVRAR